MYQVPSPEVRDCMKACGECATACAQTAHHCLHIGGEHAGPEHQALLQDCKEICALAVDFMARASRHAGHLCSECAEICNACADDCDRMAHGDQMMQWCAQACRRCAQSCERMAAVRV